MTPAKKVVTKQIGQLLIERGLLTKEQLQKALDKQKKEGRLIGQILVRLGYVTEEDIVEALTLQYGFPYLPLENYEIDKNILKVIPVHVIRHYHLIPIDKMTNVLTVVMSDPLNTFAIRDVEQMTKMRVEVFVSTATDIEKAIDKYCGKPAKPSAKEEEMRKLSKADFATTARESLEDKEKRKKDKSS